MYLPIIDTGRHREKLVRGKMSELSFGQVKSAMPVRYTSEMQNAQLNT